MNFNATKISRKMTILLICTLIGFIGLSFTKTAVKPLALAMGI